VVPGSDAHKSGLVESSDSWLALMTQRLQERADELAFREAIGADASRRAATITAVVGTSGELAIVQTIAQALPAAGHQSAALATQLQAVESRLGGLDPDSRLHASLTAQRRTLQDQLQQARAAEADAREGQARRLVSEAASGSLPHVAELSRHAVPEPVKAALRDAMGSDEQLVAVVGELIGD
jgi:hypothetical protein